MDTIDYCRRHSSQVSDNIKDEYFPNGDYDTKKDAFFDKLKDLNAPIIFPFESQVLLKKENYRKIVQVLPEFLASIFQLGFDKVTTFVEYNDQVDKKDILVTKKNLRHASEVILDSHILLHDLILSGYNDQYLKNEIFKNLKTLNFRKTHYDIIGCFQVIHSSFNLLLDLPGNTSTREIDFKVHMNDLKRKWLYILVGNLSIPQRMLMQQKNLDPVDLQMVRAKILSGFANPHIFPKAPKEEEDRAISKQVGVGDKINEAAPEYEMVNGQNSDTEKQITLIPRNAEKRKHCNQIVIGENDPITVQNSPFDFLYWIAWCDLNGKPQLKASDDLSNAYINQILNNCSEKIRESRFGASWTNKDNANKKWDAQSQINALLDFELIGSSSEIFSINTACEFELRPYPIK